MEGPSAPPGATTTLNRDMPLHRILSVRDARALHRQELRHLGDQIAAFLARKPLSLRAHEILDALGLERLDPRIVPGAVQGRQDIAFVQMTHYRRYYHVSQGELGSAYYTRTSEEETA